MYTPWCAAGQKARGYSRGVLIRFEGTITPMLKQYLERKLDVADKQQADLVIIEIESPGGYLTESLEGYELLPDEPFIGNFETEEETASLAVTWLPEGGEVIAESYVNLIPTTQGGTHVNGFRSGLLASLREFCEFRKLLPRGVKLAPDDIWDRCSYILSVKNDLPGSGLFQL